MLLGQAYFDLGRKLEGEAVRQRALRIIEKHLKYIRTLLACSKWERSGALLGAEPPDAGSCSHAARLSACWFTLTWRIDPSILFRFCDSQSLRSEILGAKIPSITEILYFFYYLASRMPH